MIQENRKIIRNTLIALVVIAFLLYAVTSYGQASWTRTNVMNACAVQYEGKEPGAYQRLERSIQEAEPAARLFRVTRLSGEAGRAPAGRSYSTDSAGAVYVWEIVPPSIASWGSFLWLSFAGSAFIAFILYSRLQKRVQREQAAPVGDMLLYMRDMLSGHSGQERSTIFEGLLNHFEERDRAEIREALLQIQENELWRRQFSANVSHELKSPLTSINGYAELLERGMADPADVPAFGGIIHREGVALLQMINEIIQLSKFDAGYLEKEAWRAVDLSALVQEEIRSIAASAAERRVSIHCASDSGTDGVRCYGSERLLREIVRNLLSNAVKYAKPEGGRVEVELRDLVNRVELCVSDEGVGIGEEQQTRIFERFYVVDPARTRGNAGTGLGLALVKHAVQVHGGRVEVSSRLGVGSVFRVSLPKRAS